MRKNLQNCRSGCCSCCMFVTVATKGRRKAKQIGEEEHYLSIQVYHIVQHVVRKNLRYVNVVRTKRDTCTGKIIKYFVLLFISKEVYEGNFLEVSRVLFFTHYLEVRKLQNFIFYFSHIRVDVVFCMLDACFFSKLLVEALHGDSNKL